MSRTGSLPAALLLAALMLAVPGTIGAVEPPALLNYQGVLRDAAGAPLSGSYDMVFRFFDAATSGNEILLDRHMVLNAKPVAVSGGLFSVALGDGLVVDGSGPGVYASLAPLFRDYASVWLEVTIGAETLAPRTRIQAAGYALNASTAESAGRLNGQSSSFFLDTSSTAQTKNGTITFRSADPGVPVVYAYSDPGSPVALVAQNSSGTSCKIGYGTTGIECYAGGIGAFFGSTLVPINNYAYNAYSGYGVYAGGSSYGGHFEGTRPNSSGVEGVGPVAGGHFRNINTGAEAFVGSGSYGIESYGGYGGKFEQTSTNGYASVLLGYVGYGLYAQSTNGVYTLDGADGSWSQIGNGAYKVRGTGSVSFVQNHPDASDRSIVYHAPESSEVNVYTRGSARLKNGVARVDLDPTFAWTANPDVGLTASVTPRGAEPVALSVERVSTRDLVVRGPAGSDVAFDFWITGLRIGFEEMPVVTPREHEAAIPAKAAGTEVYASDAGLRSYNALERYRAMDRQNGRAADPEMKASGDLVRRIGHGHPVADALATGGHDARRHAAANADAPGTPAAMTSPGAAEAPGEAARADRNPAHDQARGRDLRPRMTEFFAAIAPIEAGDVVIVDAAGRGAVRRADHEGDRAVVGIAVSPAAGGQVEVAYGSVVEVRADAGYGRIVAGDLLVSSPTPGAARTAPAAEPGTILGKALEPLDSGLGTIRVLVTLR
ncbi:MAG TPA: hypothetical protein VFQ07_17635 [Candidatus Polarisedimenticolia bacterium]|nr:hypothetical protein [Candidatus Polarisedimenticolia bacterium]